MRALVLVLVLAFTAAPAAATRVTMPHLVGKQRSVAVAQLHRLRLAPKVVYVKSLELVGTVVKQSVKAGVKVARGTRVSLSVSSGVGP